VPRPSPARGERLAERLERPLQQERERLEPSTGQSSSSVVSKRSGSGALRKTPRVLAAGELDEARAARTEPRASAAGGSRARSPIVRRPQRAKSCRCSSGSSRSAIGSGASAAASPPAGTTVSPGQPCATTSAVARVKASAACASIAFAAAAATSARPSSWGVGQSRPSPESRAAPVSARGPRRAA
jgi:hypothetical protein